MTNKKILVIHPYDKTTAFLCRIKTHLVGKYYSDLHHFNVYPNKESHENCLERIKAHPKGGLVVFLGHGKSDMLYGSKGNHYGSADFVTSEAMEENPHLYFYHENFIGDHNCDVFDGKNIFCLACNSNDQIALSAVDSGARSFLGFGDLPTSISEFIEKEKLASRSLVASMKAEINYIIKKSLVLGIEKNLTMESLLDYIRFITNQRITDLLVNIKGFKYRRILADHLFYLKTDAKITGDRNAILVDL